MNQTFEIDLMSFACLKASNKLDPKDHGEMTNGPMWANQIRGIWLDNTKVLPENAAKLMVEHNVNFDYPNLHGSYYSPTYGFLAKVFRTKTFLLVPDNISLDERLNLHNDNGPAVVFGKFQYYFLHGLQLSNEDAHFVHTDVEKIDPQTILAIRNADLRREMIRKKGIEQVLEGLFHRTIDTQGDYSLVQVILGTTTNNACNYLKMLNPSVGCWHMEGVPNNLRTVREALLWRNNGWFDHAEKIT